MTLQLDNLSCGYGKDIIVHIQSILLPKGHISLLVGHNGSGKTTFLKTLCRVIPVINGTIPDHIRTCLLPEEVDFAGNLGAEDIFKTLCPKEGQFSEILGALEIPGKKRFSHLSKGNRQKLRIAIAESLAGRLRKTILCLDEPLSGLDVSARVKIIQAWNGEGELGRIWAEFKGHRIISQHAGRAPQAFQTIAVANGRTFIFPPIETCDNWPEFLHDQL